MSVLLYKLMNSGTTSMVSTIFSYWLWYFTAIHVLNHFHVGLYPKYYPLKSFTYDYAYGGSDSNEEVYEGAVKKIVMQLFTGYNMTVEAYGQTESGKTHSMGTAYK